jgi:hypothetical protein
VFTKPSVNPFVFLSFCLVTLVELVVKMFQTFSSVVTSTGTLIKACKREILQVSSRLSCSQPVFGQPSDKPQGFGSVALQASANKPRPRPFS